jgi:hypothetical protein
MKSIAVWSAWVVSVSMAVGAGEDWQPLFNGKDLTGWKKTPYVAPGEIRVLSADPKEERPTGAPIGPAIYLGAGDDLTGITYTNPVPTTNYEIRLQAMRVSGSDFFCGLTFPVGTNFCTLVVGGWGGTIVGISSIDGYDASENETSTTMEFERGRWYDIGVRVWPDRLQVTLDGKKIIDVHIAGRRVHMRPGEIEEGMPFSISTWRTAAAIRDIRIRRLPAMPPES